MNQVEKNRSNAMAFYDLMYNKCDPKAAIERYVGDVYIQHNPDVPDGKKAFIDYFEWMATEFPGKKVEFKRTVAEASMVVLHCLHTRPGVEDYAGIDIFRFDDSGKIVEHWDVLQPVPKAQKHPNTMF